jgi:hypothetical protein
MNSLRIKYIPVILIFLLTHSAGIAQKVNVQVIKTAKAGLAEWQILDGQYRQVVSGIDFFREDTISFSLETGNRYLLQVSILEIYQDNAPPVPAGDALVCGGVVSGTYSIEPQPGVSEYEWQLYPEGASVIAGNSESADVTWNSKYFGEATVKLRITIDNELSE